MPAWNKPDLGTMINTSLHKQVHFLMSFEESYLLQSYKNIWIILKGKFWYFKWFCMRVWICKFSWFHSPPISFKNLKWHKISQHLVGRFLALNVQKTFTNKDYLRAHMKGIQGTKISQKMPNLSPDLPSSLTPFLPWHGRSQHQLSLHPVHPVLPFLPTLCWRQLQVTECGASCHTRQGHTALINK